MKYNFLIKKNVCEKTTGVPTGGSLKNVNILYRMENIVGITENNIIKLVQNSSFYSTHEKTNIGKGTSPLFVRYECEGENDTKNYTVREQHAARLLKALNNSILLFMEHRIEQ